MLIIRGLEFPGRRLVEVAWQLGKPWPKLPFVEVYAVVADGDELAWIEHQVFPECRWEPPAGAGATYRGSLAVTVCARLKAQQLVGEGGRSG